MLEWLSQHIATIIICAVLAVIFGLMLWSLLRDKKKGRSSCCGGCAGCAMAGHCHPEANKSEPDKDPPSEQAPEKAIPEPPQNPLDLSDGHK